MAYIIYTFTNFYAIKTLILYRQLICNLIVMVVLFAVIPNNLFLLNLVFME